MVRMISSPDIFHCPGGAEKLLSVCADTCKPFLEANSQTQHLDLNQTMHQVSPSARQHTLQIVAAQRHTGSLRALK